MTQNSLATANVDAALIPPFINTSPGGAYHTKSRRWQGIPGIEITSAGRLWATWYSGGYTESAQNYVLLVTSGDGGTTWSEPILVVDPPGNVRAFDPVVWIDPSGRLWLFWAQSESKRVFDGRVGVWAIHTDCPEQEKPVWSEPKRLANGVMMNKPTVLSTGEWMMPAATWTNIPPETHDLPEERFSNVYVSTDQGETWTLRGSADVPDRSYDEHMIVERKDGTLWMLVRCMTGIREAVSNDRGKTWIENPGLIFRGPTTRFFLRRLSSGALLLVYHFDVEDRTALSARISRDDGKTWEGSLPIDEKRQSSYPDGVQDEKGNIYIIRDHDRRGTGSIWLARFQEEDVLRGRFYCLGSTPLIHVNALDLSQKRHTDIARDSLLASLVGG